MADFELPEFLQNQDTDTIHTRMLNNLPDDIDISEGSHPYNLTRPVAYEIARMIEDILPDAISLMFPKYCDDYSDILDEHARIRGMSRKPAEYATGVVTVTGDEGIEIEAGEVFETYSIKNDDDEDVVVSFETTEDATIPESGTVDIPVQAVDAGAIGNVVANAIIDFSTDGVSNVTNANPTTGGLDEESDEDLQQRIIEYDEERSSSSVGSVSDYKRWAEEVAGVGTAVVVSPQVGGDPIRIILVDDDGNPATSSVATNVYNHIMGVETDESDRLAPVNATISVEIPSTVAFYVKANILLEASYTQDDLPSIKGSFIEELEDYFEEVASDGEIKYSRVCSGLSASDGVYDFSSLQMKVGTGSYGTSNISTDSGSYLSVSAENLDLTIVSSL